MENWDPSDPKAFDSAKTPGHDKDDDGSAEIDLDATEEADEEEDDEEDEEDPEWTEWHKRRKAVQPQPDLFDYPEDYYVPEEDALLSKEFKDSGLQIIVKMASIELTPEKPEFPAGGWHVRFFVASHSVLSPFPSRCCVSFHLIRYLTCDIQRSKAK